MTSRSYDGVEERAITSAASGCLYASVVVGLSAGLLFLNAFFCLAIYAMLPATGDESLDARLEQMFYFVVPVVLLVVEWHLLDRIQRLFRGSG